MNLSVLHIILDDARADFGAFGQTHVATPAIDAFAASALKFTNAYAQVALCCPSRSSFLSGRRPASNRLWNVVTHSKDETSWRHSAEGRPYDELVSLPQAFKGNGKQMVGACRISPDTDPEAPLLVTMPKGVDAPEYIEGSFASGMASGDWDGDGKADLAIAMPDRVDFYLSAGRSAGHLPGVGAPTHSVNLDIPDFRLRENWQRLRNAEVGEVDELAMADDKDFDTAPHYMVAKDFDLDGEVELVVAESTGLLVLKFDGQEWRTAREEYLNGTDASYGLGAADLNNDGVADVLASSAHGMHVLFAKPPETARRFLAVTLQGTQANAYGIGATVVLWASDMGPCRQVRSQLREVQTHGYGVHEDGASSDDRLVFGLGEHGVPLNLTVRWPGPTWAEQVVSGAELSEAVGSTTGGRGLEQMRRPLVVTEPS